MVEDQQLRRAVAAPTLVHGEGEGHVRRLCVHTQVLQEAHQVGVGGQIVHLTAPKAGTEQVAWLKAFSVQRCLRCNVLLPCV